MSVDLAECATDDCSGVVYAKGFCQKCYRRDYRARNLERDKARGRAYYEANRDRWEGRQRTPERIAYMREYRSRNAERLREQRLERYRVHGRDDTLRQYGLTAAEYDEMEAEQGGVCAICKEPEPSSDGRRLAVDHCHETGVVRALLCTLCNHRIGWMEQHPKRFRRMLQYIEEHQRAIA